MAVFFWYLSINYPIAALQKLSDQGIPLDIWKTFSTIGWLIALFPLIDMFFIKPLQESIQLRTSHLESTFAEAESLRTEMQTMRGDYEKRLAATEANAREQIQNQIREAQVLRQTLMAEASARADEMVARAEQEIEAEKQKAITDIRMYVVDLTLTAAEKVIGESMDNARNRRLVEDFVSHVEVAK